MKVLSLNGSLRSPSNTQRALDVALAAAAAAGADAQALHLGALQLPWCDGRPDESTYGGDAPALRAAILGADALLVGSPEYHGSFSGALKNALDLVGPTELRGKLVGLVATARGDAGAMNTLNHLRHVFRWVEAWVLPAQVSIPRAGEAFAADGAIVRPGLEDELARLGREIVRFGGLLRATPPV